MADQNYILATIGAVAGAALTAYVTERAKNRAARADVRRLTEEIESVKSRFTKEIENLKATHQLRTACIDKRLTAHQQAYALWAKLVQGVHGPENGSNVTACQTWWNENCLFLEQEPREMFVMAFRAAHQHPDLLRGRRTEQTIREEIDANWEHIVALGSAIERAVGLPAINGVVLATADKPAQEAKQ